MPQWFNGKFTGRTFLLQQLLGKMLHSFQNVDGATYWVTKVDARIMSLDHEHERVTPVPPLPPVIAGELDSWWITRLTEVFGRLGVAITSNHKTTASKYNNVEFD
uniref:Uncharacterized protein n=1 Tax=Oryza glumipatula TaxID=40148 RepID=A0A0E0BSY2_9ORYZ